MSKKPRKTQGFCKLRRVAEGHIVILLARAHMGINKSTQLTLRTIANNHLSKTTM